MWRNTCLARQRRHATGGGARGFTLIELAVMDFVVAIFAAVAIPVYVGVQANAKRAVVGYQTDNQPLPGAINAAALGASGYRTTTLRWSPLALSASTRPSVVSSRIPRSPHILRPTSRERVQRMSPRPDVRTLVTIAAL